MNGEKCKFQKYIIDYVEKSLKPEMVQVFQEHLESCAMCKNELAAVEGLYQMLDGDEVMVPGDDFFQQARLKARQQVIPARRVSLSWLPRVLAPVFALLVVVLAVTFWPRPAVEISVPVSDFIYDENLNALLIERIVDDDLMAQLNDLDENLAPGINESLDELTDTEKIEFMDLLSVKYHDAIL